MPSTNRIRRDLAWLRRARNADEDLAISDVTENYSILGVMGPESRALLQSLSDADFSDAAFPFFSHRSLRLGGIDVRATRLSYVGELGWEVMVPNNSASALFDALMRGWWCPRHTAGGRPRTDGAADRKAVSRHRSRYRAGHQPSGSRPRLRREAGQRPRLHWTQRFVAATPGGHPKPGWSLCCRARKHIWPIGQEPLLSVTAKNTSDRSPPRPSGIELESPVALAYVDAAFARQGRELQIDIAGTLHPATISLQAAFDPYGHRMKPAASAAVSCSQESHVS